MGGGIRLPTMVTFAYAFKHIYTSIIIAHAFTHACAYKNTAVQISRCLSATEEAGERHDWRFGAGMPSPVLYVSITLFCMHATRVHVHRHERAGLGRIREAVRVRMRVYVISTYV